jgi:tryptophan synthase beta chain
MAGTMDPVIRAVEPAAAPSLTRGSYRYDFGDTGEMTPLVKMHTLGHPFIPAPIHAGGLRYHGMAPLVSHLKELGLIEATALQQTETFEKAVRFARVEGIVPGPEPTHAIAEAMTEAERAKESGEEKVILFNLSGHGHFDMGAYQAYFNSEMVDYQHPQAEIDAAMAKVPVLEAQR